MSWLLRGIQSAIFHYASCAPCTGYMYRKQRRKHAKRDRKERQLLQLEQPELYHHPEPTGTNPYWGEEISMGPGPPPRRAKRSNTGYQRNITTAGTQSTQGDKSLDLDPADDLRLSDETTDDDNWNRKRYQRDDEELWGFGEPMSLTQPGRAGSSVGVGGIVRPGTKSSTESYYTHRNPPVNDLHPPVVSLPSPHPANNRWMLQPPPKASVMSGKERATPTNRSRSGSGASSRVELSLQRQVSTRHLQQRLERGETPEMPSISRGSSYNNLMNTQRQARPISAASSREKNRRDTAITRADGLGSSSGESSETILRTTTSSSKGSTQPSVKVVRVRSSRQKLSTVISSGSLSPPTQQGMDIAIENENLPQLPMQVRRAMTYSSTQSSESLPYRMKHRNPLTSSDVSSLNVLQDLVSPRALLDSRYVSAPLVEARIRLPPADTEEETTLDSGKDMAWDGSGLGLSRGWRTDQNAQAPRVPFDSSHLAVERDPRMRWSVDF